MPGLPPSRQRLQNDRVALSNRQMTPLPTLHCQGLPLGAVLSDASQHLEQVVLGCASERLEVPVVMLAPPPVRDPPRPQQRVVHLRAQAEYLGQAAYVGKPNTSQPTGRWNPSIMPMYYHYTMTRTGQRPDTAPVNPCI